MFTELREQHRLILLTAATLVDLVGRPTADAASDLNAARIQLAQQLARHLKSEDDQLHLPLRNKRASSLIPHYDQVALATRELRLTYSAHIAKWRPVNIAADWVSYGNEVRGLLTQLQTVIEQEETFIYPAAQTLLSPSKGG